jgi:hypothetical protein
MAKFHRLNVPSFDLTWLSLTELDHVALIAGGGGSFKSGVKNQIQIARVHDSDKVEFLQSYVTDEDNSRRLCSGLATGRIGVRANMGAQKEKYFDFNRFFCSQYNCRITSLLQPWSIATACC